MDFNNFITCVVRDGKTGYELEHGHNFEGVSVPFGCAATYLQEDPDKVEDRGVPGIVVGYGPDGAYKVMNLASFKNDRVYK